MKAKIKIKPLNKTQILISLDRLTRFKPTEDKYLRVFKDIVLSNLITPKFKKKELNEVEYDKLTQLAEQIFNLSFENLGVKTVNDYTINQKLLNYEKSVFVFDSNVEKLLKNKINYIEAINFFDEKELPDNLKWLKSLSQSSKRKNVQKKQLYKFPIKKLILVEGITEEILLPKFAKIFGLDFNKNGIYLISAGGKNQVVKLFYQFSDILKIPIFVLLDNDAKKNYEEIKYKLRKKDKVYIINEGEFEDIIPLNLIKRTINKQFNEYFSLKINDIKKDEPMTKVLAEIFKHYGFEFRKSDFALKLGENIKNKKDLSQEINVIISQLL